MVPYFRRGIVRVVSALSYRSRCRRWSRRYLSRTSGKPGRYCGFVGPRLYYENMDRTGVRRNSVLRTFVRSAPILIHLRLSSVATRSRGVISRALS